MWYGMSRLAAIQPVSSFQLHFPQPKEFHRILPTLGLSLLNGTDFCQVPTVVNSDAAAGPTARFWSNQTLHGQTAPHYRSPDLVWVNIRKLFYTFSKLSGTPGARSPQNQLQILK
jgi:hypothetical protein